MTAAADGAAGLRVEDVEVRFGGLLALAGVSLHAPTGQVTGLIGPNGAGKTTLFNVCSGFQSLTAGRVLFDGVDVTTVPPVRRVALGVGRTFQRMELFWTMSVRDNVALAAEAAHIGVDPRGHLGFVRGRRERLAACAIADRLLEDVGLADAADRVAGELSTGQGRLLELARALARGPRLLLLDEPSSGLDQAESAAFGELLQRLVDDTGIGVLMVEHDMSLVLSISAYVHVLHFGRALMSGRPDEVRTSEVVRTAYLGQAAS